MKIKTLTKFVIGILAVVGGVFAASQFIGQTLPGVTVSQTEFDLSSVVPEGLVGYWTFDGDDMNFASTTAETLDRSGNSNNGDATNFGSEGVIIGKIGQAIDFDGVDDHVDLGTSDVFDFGDTSPMTIALWAKPDVSQDSKAVFSRRGVAAERYSLQTLAASFRWHFKTACYAGQNGVIAAATVGAWQHVAVTFDGSTSRLYIDGVEQDSIGSDCIGDNSGSRAYIGVQGNGTAPTTGAYFDGQIDDVRVYDRALSATEVSTLHAATKKVTIQPSPNEKLTDGLVGHWTFDGSDIDWNAVEEILDLTTNNNDGDVTNFGIESATIGKLGQALDFDGSDDFIDIDDSASLSITGDISVGAWIYMRSAPTGGGAEPIVKKRRTSSDSYQLLTFDSSGTLTAVWTTDTGSSVNSITGELQLNQWYHVMGTWDGSNQRIYLDGVEVDVDAQTGSMDDTTDSVVIGHGSGLSGTFQPFDGFIDDVRIYNRALSASEVAELAGATNRSSIDPGAGQAALESDGLVDFWSFNGQDMDFASTTGEAIDQSGTDNRGDVQGSAAVVPGKIGQAITFDGVDDEIQITSAVSLDVGTYVAWVKPSFSLDPSDDYLILSGNSSGNHFSFGASTFGGFDNYYATYRGGFGATCDIDVNPALTADGDLQRWTHVALTFDISSGSEIFIDGQSEETLSCTTGSVSLNEQYIGSEGGGRYWEGEIDEVRIYNRVLTDAEILELYQGN